jgi:nicotinamidase-related amidase
LQPAHTALLLLNLSPVFYARGAQDGFNALLIRTLPAIQNLLARAREAGVMIIHGCSASGPYWTLERTPVMAGFEARNDEQVVACYRSSAFADSQLQILLRSNCIRTVVVAGAPTNGTVETTAREAADKDYHVVVADDCVAVRDPDVDLHAASLENIRRYFGEVMDSRAISTHWPSAVTIWTRR